MRLDATTRRREGVTLVELRLRNEGERCRVRVENRLDDPVWYPRRGGEAAPGWDESGFAGVVPAGGTLALGYATPAAPDDPPAAVEETGAPAEAAKRTPGDVVAVPDAVAAWLEDVAVRAPDLDDADRRALATVADRVAALRER